MPGYELREAPPSVEDFLRLRDAAGMSERSHEGVERGLPNSLFAVTVVERTSSDGAEAAGTAGENGTDADGAAAGDGAIAGDRAAAGDEAVVGMARVVGDGGSVYHVCDMVVHPDHQGRGLGSRMMDAVMDWISETAPPNAYVNLMADVDGFYERWGFEETAPASKGMFYRVGDASSE